jgi:hypothetical protein
MYISSLLIENFGSKNFILFAAITALPMYLPFADLGLGVSWINNVVAQDNGDNQSVRRFSESYFTILFLLFGLVCILNAGLIYVGFWDLIFPNSDIENINILCSIIICGTFLAAPFALCFRKFQFENKLSHTLLIQGAIPIISASLITLSVRVNLSFEYMLVIPLISYLVTTFIAFNISRMNRYVRFVNLNEALRIAKGSFITGTWSVILIVLTVLTFQVPRIILFYEDVEDIALLYSFALMLVLPAMSLFSVLASASSVEYLRIKKDFAFATFRKVQFRSLFYPVLLVSLGVILVGFFVETLNLTFLDFSNTLILIPFLLLCCMSQFVFVIQSREHEIRRNTFYLGLVLVSEILAIKLNIATSFRCLVLIILLPLWLLLTAKLWYRLGQNNISGSIY